jgi:heme-degrading monooxygenase HmoA
MYLTREEVQVAFGKTSAFERDAANLFTLLGEQPGFLRATLLHSLGVPFRYTCLVQWDNRESAKTFEHAAAMERIRREQSRRQLSCASRPFEAYENVHRILGPGKAVACYLIDEIVARGPKTLQEFEESRGAVYQLRRQFGPGFAASLLSRFLGGANRYLIFGGFEHEGDDQRTAQTDQIVAFWREHPVAGALVTSAVRDPQALVFSATDELV